MSERVESDTLISLASPPALRRSPFQPLRLIVAFRAVAGCYIGDLPLSVVRPPVVEVDLDVGHTTAQAALILGMSMQGIEQVPQVG